ncbi:glycosyltransferase family 4 protein [Listeria booriae]|uniref:Glycosyltransferase family 4 protein n=1 Tax=Listeria booriae TaxID=1552123 RepID=A0A841Y3N2_9LIST|nr:glycosyltransferase [Listeria booriae]MBC1372546.1 glycosyltransferase family 4 protein [Listeria booriae]
MLKKMFNISSVHPWSDTRIFFREATSIAENLDYHVTHIAVQNQVSTNIDTPISMHLLPKLPRLKRYQNWRRIWQLIQSEKPDVIHLHDPELLLLAWFIKKRMPIAPIIIYDMHENVPQIIASKQAIPSVFRKIIKRPYQMLEKKLMQSCDGIIFAEAHYHENYTHLTCPTVDIYNYPAIRATSRAIPKSDIFTFVYIGSISELRGARLMIGLAKKLATKREDFRIRVIGTGKEVEIFKAEVELSGVSKWISFEGPKKFDEAFQILQMSHVGLSLLLDNANFRGCKPTKCMEYMAAGIPFIVSDFLMQEDLKRYPCGVSADTSNLDAIVDQALFFMGDKQAAKEMGECGFRAFQEAYNWPTEEAKLISFYTNFEDVTL